ncbi:acyloxyacyl hydrolase [Roseivirga sp. BDSF3-8]|uniref:acyloxyacyl hydrolase n=1 Tax=Roseivirga sp. BDSF3-8 TaxID=3241598 RepID=UPI00353235AF
MAEAKPRVTYHQKAVFRIATGTILLFLFVFSKVEGRQHQESKPKDTIRHTHSLDIQPFYGFIMQHAPSVAHLVDSHPRGLQLDFRQHTYGYNDWEAIYNYPDAGLSLTYFDYQNEELGKSVGLLGFYDVYFLRKSDHTLRWRVGFGAGYHTTPYDREENNKNNLLGSTLTFALQSRLSYAFRFHPQWESSLSVSLTHFSNGAISKPNKGINIPGINTGIAYRLEAKEPEYKDRPAWIIPDRRWHINILLSGGVKEIEPLGLPRYPFMVATTYADYRASQRSALQIGIEGFFSRASREEIRWDRELQQGNKPDYRRIGIIAGHELLINRLSIVTQAGFYIYAPYNRDKPVYQRYGLKYYWGKGGFASLMLKTHLANADAVECGVGWRI